MTNTKEARFEISTICNYECIMCPLSSNFKREKTIMDTSLFIKLLNKMRIEIPYIENITLSGMGEPTLDRDYIKKLEIAKNMGFKTYFLSNGSNFNKDDINYLIRYKILDNMRFSLHSLNREHYKKITNTDNLEIVLNNINYFIETKRLYNSKINLIISADIVEEFSEDAIELISTFKDKVDLLEIWRPHNWVSWKQYRKGSKIKKTCGRPFNGPLQIQVDGTVNMCCFDYNNDLIIGDFKTQTLKEIFSSNEYNKILNFHKGNDYNIICKGCDQLYEKNESIMIYNSKFEIKDRINRVSTNYEKL